MKCLQILASAAVLSILALTGCSAESLAERAVEKTLENAGGEGADVDFDADTGEFKVETDEGSFSSGSSLPEGFPSDEVPLLDGTIVQAAASDSEGSHGFVVLMRMDGTLDEALEAGEQRLVEAGFESDPDVADFAGMSVRQLLKPPYGVTMQASETEEGVVVNYVVVVE